MKLYIVVPTFERHYHINELIRQLKNQTYQDFELIVVDHGIRKVDRTENIHYIDADSDLWWSGAINVGIRYILNNSKDNLPILVINDDVQIVDKEYLKHLMTFWINNKTSLVGSVCTTQKGEVIYCNMTYNYCTAKLNYHYKGRLYKDIKNEYLKSDVLKGRGTLVASNIFRKIGLFNEKYLPHYKADHEFAYRAAKKNFNLFVLKKAHLHSVLDSPFCFDKDNKLSSLKNILFKVKSVNNLKDLLHYSFLCFTPLYALYYFAINTIRIVGVNLKKLYVNE